MARKSVYTLLFLLLALTGKAQYANDWINYSQSYYKIPISSNGIYRLTYADLQSAGFPVNAVDPRFIQIFHRGVEQAITMQGEANAVFDPGDYVEFYGLKNDGTLDKNLYNPPSVQPHTYYNLYSDTTAYFLTWNQLPIQGKRMGSFSEVNVSNIPAETYQNGQRLLVIADAYSGGYTYSDEMEASYFDVGEGWTGIGLQQSSVVDYTLDLLTNLYASAGSPQLEVMLMGIDQIAHSAEIYVGANSSSLRLVATENFNNYENPVVSVPISLTDIGSDGKMVVRMGAVGSGTSRYQFATSYIRVTFPQTFDVMGLTEKIFQLNTNISDKSFIQLSNPASNMRLWDITDPENVSTIGTALNGSLLTAVVSGTSTARTLYVNNSPKTPVVTPASFRQVNPAIVNYIIVTNKVLAQAAGGYNNVIEEFASYRASAAGGGYDTLTITVDQLYNQFNYGETSPLAVYQFMKYMVAKGNPKYLFLIGKGREIYTYSPYHRKTLLSGEFKDLVPAGGSPASDAIYTAGLKGTTYEPAVPTGRLPASTAAQVAAYLNKVKEIESAPITDAWRKQGLHLSGGIQSYELTQFKEAVDGFKKIAEGNYWGGNITTISKRDATAVQLINISDEINKGVDIVTFYGHSAPSVIDIDIGFASDPTLNYNNQGKYPVFLINGCNAGAFFLNGTVFGEDWVLTANKGARNFIAHSGVGFTNLLQEYSTFFYQIGFGDSTFIQKGIGDIQKEVGRQFYASNGIDITTATQIQQMILLGDPAMKLFGTIKPDYAIDNTSLLLSSLDGKPVTFQSDSFAIRIIVENLGATNQTPLPIRIVRTFSDNTSKTYDSTFSPVLYQDTLFFKISKEDKGFGVNEFNVTLDPLNTIKELNKQNNTATLNASIPSNGTKNIYPIAYGIANDQTVNFLFQDSNLLGVSRDFDLQIDTVSSFDSPYLIQKTITAKILAKLSATLLSKDSTVYYWRTRFNKPGASESVNWYTTSFSYINNSQEGWAQMRFPQLSNNILSGLQADNQLERLSYLQTITNVAVKNFGAANATPYTSVSFKINNSEYNLGTEGQPCRLNTINLVAFNKNTTIPYGGIPAFNFEDPRSCGREPQVIDSFAFEELETGNGDDIGAYVDNIQTSDSVVLFSIGDPGFSSWSGTVLAKLNELGISDTQITSLQTGEPVVIFARKGAAPGTAKIYKTSASPANSQELDVAGTITGSYSSGSMKSVSIGPANKWAKFVSHAAEVEPTDQVSYTIYGVSLDGREDLIQSNIINSLDISFIDAKAYPYLKVALNMTDNVNLTAVQLNKWLVLYETVAEGLLVYKGPSDIQTVDEGQSFSSEYAFVNISTKNFADSLTVNQEIVNKVKSSVDVKDFKIGAPAPGDTTSFSISVNTLLKAGSNDVNVFVNRKVLPEQDYDNNVIDLTDYLQVTPDLSPPVLDVMVDGRHLRNGDYISPNPDFKITVHDDNSYLFITDTTHLNISLQYPCSSQTCSYSRISFSRSDVQWSPSSATVDFTTEFKPQGLAEGTYTLQVQATDASNNSSGASPYEITFQVKDQTSLSFQTVYPNPSSDTFHFGFVLTGNVLPDDFALQIFSMEGSVVREFSMEDIKSFHIGINELSWEGSNSYGNSLPSGVYLFRINLRIGDKENTQTGKLVWTH